MSSAETGEHVEVEGGWTGEAIKSFEDLSISEELLRGIISYGWETPSAIQSMAIPAVLTDRDVIGQAQSGTGKTGTFSIGILGKLDVSETGHYVQAVVITPVRELAIQTHSVIKTLGNYMGVKTSLMVGETRVMDNINDVNDGAQVVVATPGRFIDIFQKRLSPERLAGVKVFVVDEADEMLGAGFVDQLKACFGVLPPSVQTCLFSATLPLEVLDITRHFMRNPIKILMKREEVTLQGIKQYYVMVGEEDHKVDCIIDLYQAFQFGQTIIYLNSRERVDRLADRLRESGFSQAAIHGQMDFATRKDTVAKFAAGETRILLSTDMLARGLDVQTVGVVINFDIPRSVENQIHRIGRSGRFGRKGLGINLITQSDVPQMKRIENYYETTIEELPAKLDV